MPSHRSHWPSKRAAARLPAPISIPPTRDFDGNDGPWSTFSIQIGTPPQSVKVLISTASSQTWAVVPDGCAQSDDANCAVSRGGFFDSNTSSTWHQNENAAGGLFPLTLEADLGLRGAGLYGYDTVSLGEQVANGPTLYEQVVAGIATERFWLGLFGLNPEPVTLPNTTASMPNYLTQLSQSGLIPSLSWSYTAGNQYRPSPAYGSLILGGYDEARLEPNDVSFSLNNTDSRDFRVNIGLISLNGNDIDYTADLYTENESISVLIDSTTPYIWLPLNICQEIEQTLGIEWDESVQAYLVNDTLHDTLTDRDTSIVFNIGNSSTVPMQGFNITLPYAAFNLTASAPLLNNASRYFPLMRAANESQYVLGRTFLQEAYLIADYEHNNFSLSQCSWDTSVDSHIIAIEGLRESPSPKSNKLSAGAIAGIVVGAVVGVLLVVVLLGLYVRKKRRQKPPKQPKQLNIAPVELDAPEKDGMLTIPRDVKGYPQSPELDGAVHKGHELDAHALSPQPELDGQARLPLDPEVNQQRYELAATERRSQTLSSPISVMTERSEATRLHQRQLSEPVSLNSELSDSTNEGQREQSYPMSPMRQRSDATRLHRREISDPVSVGSVGSPGHERKGSEPISPASERSNVERGRRGVSNPISVFSEMLDS